MGVRRFPSSPIFKHGLPPVGFGAVIASLRRFRGDPRLGGERWARQSADLARHRSTTCLGGHEPASASGGMSIALSTFGREHFSSQWARRPAVIAGTAPPGDGGGDRAELDALPQTAR